ncbi:GNAT family N-acetyltransferase [Hoeflea prorocentri]|uniref:GNAT family N-acetyltransferase n=1 Tax=Hoeflea prorocentri TaxID=1922333 RepID=A0A9X3UKL3_9HYPH|nr:GNAT family N-acetyltransferase [Hoeflea prorocentri]MCY6382130.1 GNAT family N-acetyltransferase [Hoeflea prorocentri]MDA5399930.1 GNAT family N-acetyltransferase [Hoeflea prorocentri]
MIPTLNSERLLLRAPAMHDWPDYSELMQSERAVHMGGPFSTAAAWGMFCQDVAQWALMDHGALMMEDRKSGACVGQVGINHGPLFPERELGWLVYPQAEGKGYAFEAAKTLRDWAFKIQGFETLVSYIDSDNTRSIRLAERLGAILDDDAPRPHEDDLVFRHPKP